MKAAMDILAYRGTVIDKHIQLVELEYFSSKQITRFNNA